MSATKKLLDKFSETCLPRQDKEVARRLHVTHPAVSNWRNGRAHPDVASVERMAAAIGEPPGLWIAAIEAERTKSPENRKVWLRLAATFGGVLAIALTALPYLISTSGSVYIM